MRSYWTSYWEYSLDSVSEFISHSPPDALDVTTILANCFAMHFLAVGLLWNSCGYSGIITWLVNLYWVLPILVLGLWLSPVPVCTNCLATRWLLLVGKGSKWGSMCLFSKVLGSASRLLLECWSELFVFVATLVSRCVAKVVIKLLPWIDWQSCTFFLLLALLQVSFCIGTAFPFSSISVLQASLCAASRLLLTACVPSTGTNSLLPVNWCWGTSGPLTGTLCPNKVKALAVDNNTGEGNTVWLWSTIMLSLVVTRISFSVFESAKKSK